MVFYIIDSLPGPFGEIEVYRLYLSRVPVFMIGFSALFGILRCIGLFLGLISA